MKSSRPYFLLLLFLALFAGLALFFLRETPTAKTSSYRNEEYGFDFSAIPSDWSFSTVTDTQADPHVFAHFSWGIPGLEESAFDVFVTDANPEMSGIAPLGQSDKYHYYYVFSQYPFECTYYLEHPENADPTDKQFQEKCQENEASWSVIEKTVVPGFSVITN